MHGLYIGVACHPYKRVTDVADGLRKRPWFEAEIYGTGVEDLYWRLVSYGGSAAVVHALSGQMWATVSSLHMADCGDVLYIISLYSFCNAELAGALHGRLQHYTVP